VVAEQKASSGNPDKFSKMYSSLWQGLLFSSYCRYTVDVLLLTPLQYIGNAKKCFAGSGIW